MERLSEKTWQGIELDTFADVSSGRDIYAQERVPGSTPYVTAGVSNNGIGYFVGNDNDSKARNAISVARNGAVGEAFYHPYLALYGNDCRRVNLRATDDGGTQIFVANCISEQKSTFSYGRKLGTARLKRLRVMLPVDDSGEPDYTYMASYANEIGRGLLMRYKSHLAKRISNLEHSEIPELNEKNWKKFKVFGDEGFLHIATTSSSIDGVRLKPGVDERVPYVTRTDTNNGIGRFVSDANFDFGFDEGGCITIGLDTQTAFWQPTRFVTGQNVQVITGDCLSFLFAQFLIPLLRLQMRAKFNWGGNGATLTRMKKLEMMLPVNDDGEIDILYMEQYATNMLLKKYEQYLAFLDRKASV